MFFIFDLLGIINLFHLESGVGFVSKGFDKSVSDENGGIPSTPVYNNKKGQESRFAKVF